MTIPGRATPSDEITGILERIVFESPENGFVVARLQERGKRELTTVVGTLHAQPGESLRLRGSWVEDRKFGRQFKVDRFESVIPATATAIQKYLGSGLIRGVGPVFAGRIVKVFGERTLDVIDREPDRLLDVEGIGEQRLAQIKEAWNRQREIKRVVLFLQEHDVSTTHAVKIYRAYGDRSVEVLKENPYRLAGDIHGIGFKTADRIAEKMGVPKDSPNRAAEGLTFILSEMADEGHVYCPVNELRTHAAERLEVGPEIIDRGLDQLVSAERVRCEGDDVFLMPFYVSERNVAERLARLMKEGGRRFDIDAERAIAWVEEKNRIGLSESQKEAVRLAVREKVLVITGNPGCGKSTLVRSIVDIVTRKGMKVELAAPTGRAARRLSELCRRNARTIHRMLEYRKGGFARNAETPLDADVVVIDEASMLDIVLMNHILKAVPAAGHLILVGDVDQLPSVGPGNVLRDIISSGVVPVVTLTEIFRQAQGSLIVTNAHRINHGEWPMTSDREDSDYFFIEEEDPERLADQVISLVTRRLPKHYRVDPVRDIQVLAPMHKGAAGVGQLNQRLQEALNPDGASITRGGRTFRVGDKVMQMVNNYDRDVFNGDIGIIESIDAEEGLLAINFEGRRVDVEASDLDELALAYACSVHKSQGSEYRIVVMPVHTQHFVMLQRNLLYTALTRARKAAVFAGTKKAMAIAIRNDKVTRRNTRLETRLREEMARLVAG